MLTNEIIKSAIGTAIPGHASRVSAITIRGGRVGFMITVAPSEKQLGLELKAIAEAAVSKLEGVESATAVVTAHESTPIAAKPEAGYNDPRARAQWNLTPIEGVKKIIAIASGKGGVGKSTTTVNLAYALIQMGKKVGILDADIYGPSIPHMLGIANEQPAIANNKMQPPTSQGIKAMSMGLITGDEAAILRGPMISKSLQQMLRFTDWGTLDVLLVDMPPGTGDIHLSMAQQVPLTGAIIVTTPQKVATIDASKCARMFQKVNVPLLGVVENMAGDIFGNGGGNELARTFNIPLFASVPLDALYRNASEAGIAPADMQHYLKVAEAISA